MRMMDWFAHMVCWLFQNNLRLEDQRRCEKAMAMWYLFPLASVDYFLFLGHLLMRRFNKRHHLSNGVANKRLTDTHYALCELFTLVWLMKSQSIASRDTLQLLMISSWKSKTEWMENQHQNQLNEKFNICFVTKQSLKCQDQKEFDALERQIGVNIGEWTSGDVADWYRHYAVDFNIFIFNPLSFHKLNAFVLLKTIYLKRQPFNVFPFYWRSDDISVSIEIHHFFFLVFR